MARVSFYRKRLIHTRRCRGEWEVEAEEERRKEVSHGVVSRSKTEEVRDDRRGDSSDAVSWKEVVVEDLKTLR